MDTAKTSKARFDFDEIIERMGTNSSKFDAACKFNPYLPADCLPMWVADMDFACPQPVLDAMKRRIDKRILGYATLCDPAYFKAVCGWMQRRHGWRVMPEQIAFSAGIVTALHKAVEMFTKPGDNVMVHTPAYRPFNKAILKGGCHPVYLPLQNRKEEYSIDFVGFEQAARNPDNTLYFLCNPHNPTGRVWTKEELQKIGEICFNNNVFVVSDEIHADLLRVGEKHIPMATLFPGEKRLMTCTAPSKTFNLAGNHLANLIFEDTALAKEWEDAEYCGSPNPLSIDACIAAYNECEDWLDALLVYLDENMQYLHDFIAKNLPAAVFKIPQGTYLAWVDLSAYGLSDQELREKVSAKGLYIQFGDEFVYSGNMHARINLACPRATLEKGAELLRSALEEE